jgi:hypothetical protein
MTNWNAQNNYHSIGTEIVAKKDYLVFIHTKDRIYNPWDKLYVKYQMLSSLKSEDQAFVLIFER